MSFAQLIKQIMRRLATDKIIVCMLLILILAILGVIIAKSANLIPGTGGKTDGAAIDCKYERRSVPSPLCVALAFASSSAAPSSAFAMLLRLALPFAQSGHHANEQAVQRKAGGGSRCGCRNNNSETR